MTAERFMVDDCGTLIDMHTRDTFDYVSDVCDLLNRQHETIQRLKENITELLSVDVEEELLKENEQLQQLLDYADDLIQSHLSEQYIRQWRNFKTGHKEYNDFWEEKIKKHKELKEG